MVGATRNLLFCLLAVYGTAVHGEMFTALVDMERLVYEESEMVAALKQYIHMEEARLTEIKRIADDFEVLTKRAMADAEEYLHHPVNAFLTVKRFLADWTRVDDLVQTSFSSDYLNNISYHRQYFPTKEDFKGSALALFRLQETYKLSPTDIADGKIQNAERSAIMTGQECFELGRVAYEDTDNYHTVLWMREALRRVDSEYPPTMDKAKILDYLSYSTYMIGDLNEALSLTQQLLAIDPTHQRALGNKAYFDNELANSTKQRGDTGEMSDDTDEHDYLEEHRPVRNVPEREAYEALCRGEQVKMTPARQKKLKCRYRHYNRPFLYLQPAKEEVVFDKPKLTLFRDALSDSDIEKVKALASPKLRRATIQNSVTGNLEFAEYRISKSAWLKDREDDVVRKISKRIEYYTGLTMDTAEELQVANYGLGGHYEPHFDFARKDEIDAFKELRTGNRIATMLFYMSDVKAVVSPQSLSRWACLLPEKGTGAFWFNLLKSGEGDYTTRHAACPVLVGSKWVSNKWIHELGQEFRRKCGMTDEN